MAGHSRSDPKKPRIDVADRPEVKELQAKLAEGLKPGEDPLYYDWTGTNVQPSERQEHHQAVAVKPAPRGRMPSTGKVKIADRARDPRRIAPTMQVKKLEVGREAEHGDIVDEPAAGLAEASISGPGASGPGVLGADAEAYEVPTERGVLPWVLVGGAVLLGGAVLAWLLLGSVPAEPAPAATSVSAPVEPRPAVAPAPTPPVTAEVSASEPSAVGSAAPAEPVPTPRATARATSGARTSAATAAPPPPSSSPPASPTSTVRIFD